MADRIALPVSRVTAIADQARRLGGVSGELTPEQIQETLENVNITLQEKTVTPGDVEQTVMPDVGYYGLSRVTVMAAEGAMIPENARLYYYGNAEVIAQNATFETSAVGSLT